VLSLEEESVSGVDLALSTSEARMAGIGGNEKLKPDDEAGPLLTSSARAAGIGGKLNPPEEAKEEGADEPEDAPDCVGAEELGASLLRQVLSKGLKM
jgi:hypothetical protein